jgi:hypothetical protein
MGDGVLVYFGYPQAHEDDAERAIRAGLELIQAVGRLKSSAPLQSRVGIATGCRCRRPRGSSRRGRLGRTCRVLTLRLLVGGLLIGGSMGRLVLGVTRLRLFVVHLRLAGHTVLHIRLRVLLELPPRTAPRGLTERAAANA